MCGERRSRKNCKTNGLHSACSQGGHDDCDIQMVRALQGGPSETDWSKMPERIQAAEAALSQRERELTWITVVPQKKIKRSRML